MFLAILQYPQKTIVIYFTAGGTNMYHILRKGQIIRLSNDIRNIKIDKRILLKTY